jgi:hypothetical protein
MATVSRQRADIQGVAHYLQQLPRDTPVPTYAVAIRVGVAIMASELLHGADTQQPRWKLEERASACAAVRVAGCLTAAVQAAPDQATPQVMAAIYECICAALPWLTPSEGTFCVDVDLVALLRPEKGSISPGAAVVAYSSSSQVCSYCDRGAYLNIGAQHLEVSAASGPEQACGFPRKRHKLCPQLWQCTFACMVGLQSGISTHATLP